MTKKVLALLTGLVLGSVFYYINWKVEDSAPKTKLCYIRNTEDGESRNMVLNISGKKVFGWLNVLPEKDGERVGVIEGKISDINPDGTRLISARWDFVSDGTENKSQINIILGEGVATFEDLNLSLVPCDTEFDQMINFGI